jgi:hypothetical protein
MKPSFALHFTDTSIGLLHRTARGWLQVGETPFDTADLTEALGYLRGSALGLSPGGLTTKLVLPNSQIKYLSVDAAGPSDTDRRNQIRAGLVGRTPYNVDELVFDWSGTGSKVQVAVVARETLEEAEAFATEHRFNPISFVGQPDKADFAGEPWFGATKISGSLLEKGEKVDRDQDAIQVTARDLPKSHPAAPKPPVEASSESTAADVVEKEKPTRAQRRAAAAADQKARDDDQSGAMTAADEGHADDVSAPPHAPSDDIFPESVPVAALPTEALADEAIASNPTSVADDAFAPSVPTSMSVTDDTAFADVPSMAPVADQIAATEDDLPPAPSPAIRAAFASRRAGDQADARPAGGTMANTAPNFGMGYSGATGLDQDSAKSAPPPLSRPKVGGDTPQTAAPLRYDGTNAPASDGAEASIAKPLSTKPNTAFVTAPTIPGSRKRKSLPPGAQAIVPGAPDARKSLTKPGGTFASSKDRKKTSYLGLILTGLLLLFLALIAAWSSFFLASNTAIDTGTAVVSAPSPSEASETPAIDDEMLADAQDPAEFTQDSGTETLAIDESTDPAISADATTDVAVLPDPVAEIPDAVANATDAAVSTDIDPATDISVSSSDTTQVPAPTEPVAAAPPPVGIANSEGLNAPVLSEAQDEIFLAGLDAPPLALDPLALPQPVVSIDALPLPQLEPPPFGTVYQFDADGRIRPTPEGIITPEGVRLVAGKPSLLPPLRPDALVAAALPATAAPATTNGVTPLVPGVSDPAIAPAQPFPSDPALAEARPRPRPDGLAPAATQADDDASLLDPGVTRVSGLRPLARPATVLAAGEAARQSTASASLTAQAEQAAAVEEAVLAASFQPDPDASPLAVRVSRKPAPRPKDMSRAVEVAVAAAVRAPEPDANDSQPEADEEPDTASAAPAIPTRASVAKQATYVNAINLAKINLIGVYGSKSSRYALIRQSNGRYKKVKVGDSIDGGRVAAINSDEVRYQKSGRMVSLKLPKT